MSDIQGRPTVYHNLVYGRCRSKFQNAVSPFRHALEVASGLDLRAALDRIKEPSYSGSFPVYRARMIRQRIDVLRDLQAEADKAVMDCARLKIGVAQN